MSHNASRVGCYSISSGMIRHRYPIVEVCHPSWVFAARGCYENIRYRGELPPEILQRKDAYSSDPLGLETKMEDNIEREGD